MILTTNTFTCQIENLSDLDFSPVEISYLSDTIDFLRRWFDDSSFIEVKTSGSTGVPKIIRLSKQTMLNSAGMTNTFFGLDEKSVALLCLPVSYIAGKMMIVRAIAGNYKLIVVEPSANPFSKLKDFNEIPSIDFAAITPYQLLNSAEDIPQSSVRQVIVGGSPVTKAMERLSADWPVAMFETFGMTETASHIALRKFNGVDYSDFFKALEGVELSLDKRGCLEIFAPAVYPEKLTTNDLVKLVSDREFQWLGRVDRVINSGGVKVFPEQIERKIQHLFSKAFFIDSQTDEDLGQKVILVVEESGSELPGIHPEYESIILKIRKVLPKFEVPKIVYSIPSFVYSAGNKVLRSETLKLIPKFANDCYTN